MSVINALFLNMGKVIPAYKMTPEIAGQLHKNLAKVMIYVKGKGVKLTKQQAEYIINQTKQLDVYEKGITPPTPTGPKADVIDLSKRLPEDAPYSEKNPTGWMPEETVSAEEEARGIRSALGFNENLVNDTINLLKDKDKKSMEQELKKIIMREGTYQDYNDSERKAILDGIQKILEARGGNLTFAMGGRVKYAFGTGKKGVQGILDLIKNKFGRKSITTADKVDRPESAVTRDMFKQFNERIKSKKGTYGSGESLYKILKSEGITIDKAVKEALADMPRLSGDAKYDADAVAEIVYQKLDIDPDTLDQHHVLDVYDKAYNLLTKTKKLTPKESFLKQYFAKKKKEKDMYEQAAEREMDAMEAAADVGMKEPMGLTAEDIYAKYQNKISDDLLKNIVKDNDPQRQAEVMGTLDEVLTMMDKGMDKDQIMNVLKNMKRTKNKDGGRIGFSVGGIDKARRALLKMFGGAAATGVAVKTGLGGLLKGGEKAKDVVKTAETVKTAANTPPNYVFDLIKIIKAKGKDITKQAGTIERETVTSYRGVELYETPNGVVIRAEGKTPYEGGKEIQLSLNKTTDVVDEGKKTQKQVSKVEYEEATVRPDPEGKMKDVDFYVDETDHAELKRIVDEEKGFKSGGLAYMLGE